MIGTTLSHYRITAKIGEGGMGEVYRAHDERLDRDVAIKVLPEAVAKDKERLARFEREAKLLASLNHTNIATLYGLEEHDGERFLVMELADGETLADRIKKGPIPVDDALPIALQIAEGLEAAHEQGIIHRDLKPANVMLSPEGKVKILDFGLAKAWAPKESDADLTHSPTLTAQMTGAGVLLGTAAYMSPEQARGKPVDKRADIWAFGVVLWEMLTGKRLFTGDTVSDVLASVLKDALDLGALPPDTPSRVSDVLRRCLVNDPKYRLRDIGDALIELADSHPARSVSSSAEESPHASRAAWRFLPWAFALIATGAAIWLAVSKPGPDEPDRTYIVASIPPPPGMGFDLGTRGLALSPDGTQLAFVARDADNVSKLWVRRLDRADTRELEGTKGAKAPFWSPDGRYLGYFAGGKIRKIEVATGVTESIADVVNVFGAAWSVSGDIVFGSRLYAPLQRVPAGGGDPVPVSAPTDPMDILEWPSFLPDGKHFLYHVRSWVSDTKMGQVRLGSIDGSDSRLLFDSNSNAQFASPGFVVWWHDGNLRAQRFDPDRLTLEGEAAVIAARAQFDPGTGSAAFSMSSNSILVYQGGDAAHGSDRGLLAPWARELAWISRDGSELGRVDEGHGFTTPRLSPDGSRIALDISDERARGDIWLLDAERGSGIRFTSFPEDDSAPVWSPLGDRLVFFSGSADGPRIAIFLRPVSMSEEAEILIQDPGADLLPVSWSRSGDLIVNRLDSNHVGDLWVYSFEDGSFKPYLASPYNLTNGEFSPDGRFVAFQSEESGQKEVYVARYPEPTERWRVSVDGGETPVWQSDGRELYFLSSDSEITAVPVHISETPGAPEAPAIELGEPKALFWVDLNFPWFPRQYDTIDGQRFLVSRTVREGATQPLTLVLDWDEGLTEQ